ncbi:MAG: hypothetical protein AABZ15_14425 [Nitrospirota bacterium]
MTMKSRSWRSRVPPAGPVISVLLVGLVLLSALLYYRSVKIQRFLEPALALSQPRNEYAKRIARIFEDVFGSRDVEGIRIKAGMIIVNRSLLLTKKGTLTPTGQKLFKKLARFFLTLLLDERMRSEINHILIIARFPNDGMKIGTLTERMDVQLTAGFVQETLLRTEPELARSFAPYFSSGAQAMNPQEGSAERIDFLIVPSEYLHIEVLEKLEKYTN